MDNKRPARYYVERESVTGRSSRSRTSLTQLATLGAPKHKLWVVRETATGSRQVFVERRTVSREHDGLDLTDLVLSGAMDAPARGDTFLTIFNGEIERVHRTWDTARRYLLAKLG